MASDQNDMIAPDDDEQAVAEGFASIEQGDFIDINGDDELRKFFDDIVARGKKRLAAER